MLIDNAELRRYEITADDVLAGLLTYRDNGDVRSFLHTETQPGFEGRGLASELVAFALDDARLKGRQVLPYCPFVRAYIERHKQYADLVPDARRAEFGLAD